MMKKLTPVAPKVLHFTFWLSVQLCHLISLQHQGSPPILLLCSAPSEYLLSFYLW